MSAGSGPLPADGQKKRIEEIVRDDLRNAHYDEEDVRVLAQGGAEGLREGTRVAPRCKINLPRCIVILLVPSPELNDIILGVLGRAQRLHGVELIGFVFLSTHFHLIIRVTDARQLADFMGYLASNLAREIARHTGWTDKIWARRYQAIIISDEEAAQTARLSYLLSHGCKEGLVEQVRDWPGVHCVHALLDGTPVQGSWFDRTKEYGARQRGEEISPRRFATTETVTLSPLPCWQHLAPEVVQEKIRAMVEDIEATAARLRSETQTTVLGPDAVQAQKHESRPAHPKKSYAPLFDALSCRLRRERLRRLPLVLGGLP